ncbi:MAG: DUF3574 domain-containing protein [Reyranellaceae bacterium]
MFRRLAVLALSVLALVFVSFASAQAQAPWGGAATLKTEVFFGLRLPDGKVVSEEEWGRFLAEVVAPRFPDGLTVIDGAGRSANAGAGAAVNPTKILVLVHPNAGDAQDKLAQVKDEYRKRFNPNAGVFHIDAPVRIAPAK